MGPHFFAQSSGCPRPTTVMSNSNTNIDPEVIQETLEESLASSVGKKGSKWDEQEMIERPGSTLEVNSDRVRIEAAHHDHNEAAGEQPVDGPPTPIGWAGSSSRNQKRKIKDVDEGLSHSLIIKRKVEARRAGIQLMRVKMAYLEQLREAGHSREEISQMLTEKFPRDNSSSSGPGDSSDE